jgi:hypothetical protein
LEFLKILDSPAYRQAGVCTGMTSRVVVVLGIAKMERELIERVENILSRIKPSLGGAKVLLKDVGDGIVTCEYYRPLSNPSACHVDRTPITKEIVIEILEDHLRNVIPGLKKVVLLGDE